MAKKISDKNRKKASLSEGFLDGEEEVTVTPEDAQPEDTTEDDVPPEDGGEEGDGDISDEGDPDGDGDEGDAEATDDEAGVEKDPEEQQEDLQDTMQTLITAVQALTDQIAKQNGDGEEGGEGEPAEGGDETAEGGDDFTDDDSEFEGGDEEGEGDDDAEFEGGDEGGEESSEEETTDETKSEAWNHFAKQGMPLNENSGYMIGKILSGRFDKLEPFVMAIVEQKIHDRVEGAKKEFRTQAYNKQYGEE